MAIAFARSMRSLDVDSRSRRSTWFLLLSIVVLAGWGVWFTCARVTRYEVSDRARLEVDQAVHILQAPIAGKVISSSLALDREVKAGDVLLEIESGPQRLELREARTHAFSLDPQIRSLEDQIATGERARAEQGSAARAALDQAQAQFREAQSQSRLADDEAARLTHLHAEKLVSDREFERGLADQRSRRAAAENLQFAIVKSKREQERDDHDREAKLEDLGTAVRKLEAEKNITVRTLDRLAYEVQRRRVLAPVGGRLGEVAVLRAGGWVDEGDKVGAIVPSGRLRVVAQFAPPAALGRIRIGQAARVRLQGFPWIQFGAITARVASVGSEMRDGQVRVELTIEQAAASIPLQHGLPGTVEVEVERVSPAVLALRAAGQIVASPKSAFSGQAP